MKRIYLLAVAAMVIAACEKGPDGNDGGGSTSDTELTYEGETYKIAKLPDGSVWMAENLRYVPKGKKVSDNPAEESGIWYPYQVKDGQPVALKDEASIKKYGYLYDIQTALGETVTPDNLKSFEGSQGICPPGWHIPSRADWLSLLGYAQKTEGMQSDETKTDAVFYDADINGGSFAKMNQAGMNMDLFGFRSKASMLETVKGQYQKAPLSSADNCNEASLYGRPTMTYCLSSTGYRVVTDSKTGALKNMQFFGAMVMFSNKYKDGRITCGYNNICNGSALRCVKDAE